VRSAHDTEGASNGVVCLQWAEIRLFAESLACIKASQIVGKAGLRPSDVEDNRQQLLLYVISHLGDYDRRKGTQEAYATMLIMTAVALLLRDRRSGKHGRGKPSASLDALTNGHSPDAEYLSRDAGGRRLGLRRHDEQDATELRLDLADAVGSLPANLEALARLLGGGHTEASVGRLTGRSRRQVRHDVEAIRAHFKCFELQDW